MAGRRKGDVVVVIVLMLALFLRLLYMGTTLEIDFVGEHLAIYLSVMAGDLQSALCTGRIVGEQRAVEYRVASDRKCRIVSSNVEQNVRNRQPTGQQNF